MKQFTSARKFKFSLLLLHTHERTECAANGVKIEEFVCAWLPSFSESVCQREEEEEDPRRQIRPSIFVMDFDKLAAEGAADWREAHRRGKRKNWSSATRNSSSPTGASSSSSFKPICTNFLWLRARVYGHRVGFGRRRGERKGERNRNRRTRARKLSHPPSLSLSLSHTHTHTQLPRTSDKAKIFSESFFHGAFYSSRILSRSLLSAAACVHVKCTHIHFLFLAAAAPFVSLSWSRVSQTKDIGYTFKL